MDWFPDGYSEVIQNWALGNEWAPSFVRIPHGQFPPLLDRTHGKSAYTYI